MNVAAEHGDDPSAALQDIAQPRHAFHGLEMKAVRADRDLKRRMVRENGDWSIGLSVDQFDQTPRLFRTKLAAIAAWFKCVQRDQPHWIIFDRIIDEFAAGREISACGKSGAQIGSIVLVAGQHVNRRTRLCE
jgi:hypothetical protein